MYYRHLQGAFAPGRSDSNADPRGSVADPAGCSLTLFSWASPYGGPMIVAARLREMWRSHRVLPRVSVVVLLIVTIELIGVAIYSFLLPVTG